MDPSPGGRLRGMLLVLLAGCTDGGLSLDGVASPSLPVSGRAARAAPIMVAGELDRPGAVAVDGANVYWSENDARNNGRVRAVPRGGGVPVTLVEEHGGPGDLAVDGPFVYWTAGDRVVRLARADVDRAMAGRETPPPRVVVSGVTGALGLAVRGGQVFFTTWGVGDGTLQRVSVEGGAPVVLAGRLAFPGAVAVGDAHVYWMSERPSGLLVGRPTHGAVTRVALSGGAPEVLVEEQWGLGALASDGGAVYWTSGVRGGSVWRVPDTGGAPAAIVTGHPTPDGIAVDGGHVYWTDRGDGTVWRASKSGEAPEQIAGGQWNPGQITVDAGSIFWIDQGDVPPLFGHVLPRPLRRGALMRLDLDEDASAE